ncbi:MAG TPA: lipid-binding SYLF domain-containing protein [Gammaproteobacteria bacterium]|nr:lipid-binding SYLF domain-containing protein [Gammaproteobacteria bacterium]
MIKHFKISAGLALVLMIALLQGFARTALAADAADIDADVYAALQSLYKEVPGTQSMAEQAKGVLVFPNIVKAGFIVGAQYGQGAMVQNGAITGYYSIKAGSYGIQAGVSGFGYAMFLMTDAALAHLGKMNGWEIGVGPSIVVIDEGVAKTLTTRTLKEDVFAVVFGQKGLMAGAGLQGSKIVRLNK